MPEWQLIKVRARSPCGLTPVGSQAAVRDRLICARCARSAVRRSSSERADVDGARLADVVIATYFSPPHCTLCTPCRYRCSLVESSRLFAPYHRLLGFRYCNTGARPRPLSDRPCAVY